MQQDSKIDVYLKKYGTNAVDITSDTIGSPYVSRLLIQTSSRDGKSKIKILTPFNSRIEEFKIYASKKDKNLVLNKY